jgi:tetratricopeptide (TPR) repeat protein
MVGLHIAPDVDIMTNSDVAQPIDQLEQVRSAFFEGREHDCLNLIHTALARCSETRERRYLNHIKGQLLMRQGEFVLAERLLKQTLADYGLNILLLIDLCACQIASNYSLVWPKTLELIQSEIAQNSRLISRTNLAKARLSLAMHLELSGFLPRALVVYRELQDDLDLNTDTQTYYRCFFNRARLHAEVGDLAKAQKMYLSSVAMRLCEPSVYFRLEIQHCLMIIELHSNNFTKAFNRMNWIVKRHPGEWEQSFFDVLYFVKLANKSLTEHERKRVNELLKVAKVRDEFEWALVELTKNRGFESGSFEELCQSISVPLHRLLLCCIQLSGAQFIDRKVMLESSLLEADQATKNFWRKRLRSSTKYIDGSLEIRIQNNKFINSRGQSLVLPRAKLLSKLSSALFSGSEVFAVEDLIEVLWGCEWTESHYRRLRDLCSRLNEYLFTLSGDLHLVEVDSTYVRINPSKDEMQGAVICERT